MQIYTISDLLIKQSFRNPLDTLSNQLTKDIFHNTIKSNNTSFNKSFPEHNFDISIFIEKINQEYIEESQYQHFVNFKVIPYNEGTFDKSGIFDYSKIIIKIKISKTFSPNDYESLNFQLYEIIRHELEHTKTYIEIGSPDEPYIELFENLLGQNNSNTLLENCQLIQKYVTHPQELPSYSRSIYYLAKKHNANYDTIIDQILDRAFFDKKNNKYIVKPEDKNNPEITEILNNTKQTVVNKIKEVFPKTMFRMLSLSCLPLKIGEFSS